MLFAGTDGWTEITNGCVPNRATATKSFAGSYGNFDRSTEFERKVKPTMPTVWPSAGERATASVPMIVFAPGRFSTTTPWPSALLKGCAIARATTSFDPPAGNGTTSRTTLDGKLCAVT